MILSTCPMVFISLDGLIHDKPAEIYYNREAGEYMERTESN